MPKIVNHLFYTLVLAFWLLPNIVLAGYKINNATGFTENVAGRAGVERSSVTNIVADGLRAGISLVGLFFFILTIYGGFIWMTARGSEERIEKGKKTVIAAIIGAAVVVMAYAITLFVGRLTN